jgi:hypothetical protein
VGEFQRFKETTRGIQGALIITVSYACGFFYRYLEECYKICYPLPKAYGVAALVFKDGRAPLKTFKVVGGWPWPNTPLKAE